MDNLIFSCFPPNLPEYCRILGPDTSLVEVWWKSFELLNCHTEEGSEAEVFVPFENENHIKPCRIAEKNSTFEMFQKIIKYRMTSLRALFSNSARLWTMEITDTML